MRDLNAVTKPYNYVYLQQTTKQKYSFKGLCNKQQLSSLTFFITGRKIIALPTLLQLQYNCKASFFDCIFTMGLYQKKN